MNENDDKKGKWNWSDNNRATANDKDKAKKKYCWIDKTNKKYKFTMNTCLFLGHPPKIFIFEFQTVSKEEQKK